MHSPSARGPFVVLGLKEAGRGGWAAGGELLVLNLAKLVHSIFVAHTLHAFLSTHMCAPYLPYLCPLLGFTKKVISKASLRVYYLGGRCLCQPSLMARLTTSGGLLLLAVVVCLSIGKKQQQGGTLFLQCVHAVPPPARSLSIHNIYTPDHSTCLHK